MKPHVADYESRLYCIRIEPVTSAPIVRLAAYPHAVTMSNGEVYTTENGYEFSGIDATSTFASTSLDLTGVLDAGAISQDDLAAGLYDNARVYVFATSWAAPIEDEEPLGKGFWGKVDFDSIRGNYTVNIMGQIDALSQSVGRSYSPSCQWYFLDQNIDGYVFPAEHSRCTGPRSAPDGPSFAALKVTGTITSVTSQYMFADSARTEVNDYFGAGSIRFTTGNNAGLTAIVVKNYTQAGGVIELTDALFYMPQVGDQYEMIPGCRKRLTEDCVGKWNNGVNFGGHAHVPSPSQYSQVGRGA